MQRIAATLPPGTFFDFFLHGGGSCWKINFVNCCRPHKCCKLAKAMIVSVVMCILEFLFVNCCSYLYCIKWRNKQIRWGWEKNLCCCYLVVTFVQQTSPSIQLEGASVREYLPELVFTQGLYLSIPLEKELERLIAKTLHLYRINLVFLPFWGGGGGGGAGVLLNVAFRKKTG